MKHSPRNAAGPAIPAKWKPSFAATMATWRFLKNENVTPRELVVPLRDCVRLHLAERPCDFVLSVSDWCKMKCGKHTAKKDVLQLTHAADVGYELTTHLLVDAEDGSPIAPYEMSLKTAQTVHTTCENPVADVQHKEQVLPMMEASRSWDLPAKIVHVIDSEADSLGHWRQWAEAGHLFLVRGGDRYVTWEDRTMLVSEIVVELSENQRFLRTRDVEIKGKKAYQEIAEIAVILERPSRHKKNGKRTSRPGKPLSLRLVISRVRDPQTHEILSTWYLSTNAPAAVPTELLALWYYWRWRIETYFKLMKSAGLELDRWQQETGRAILNRLLVASMAAAMVWNLERDSSEEAIEFKNQLVGLSGKTVKRSRPHTPGALLSGLFVLFQIFDFLEEMDFDVDKILKLRAQLDRLLPGLPQQKKYQPHRRE